MRPTRILTLAVLASVVFAFVADGAEGQQRRRRRPPRHHAAPASAPAEPAPAPEAAPPPEADAGAPAAEAAPPPAEAGAPSAEPAPAPEPPPPAEDPLALPDVAPVRAELEALMDELVETRSRIAVLGRQLFQTRVRVVVRDRTGDDQLLERLDLRLDGAPIFAAERGAPGASDGRQVFEGFAAPGPHVLTVSLEQRARADEEFRHTQDDTFRFQVVRGRLTEITVVLENRSDIAEDFADDGAGEFDVRTRVRVAARELGDE
jgi:hypothetical protein